MNEVYWGNTLREYLIAAGGIIIGFIILRILRTIVLSKLSNLTKRTTSDFDDVIIHAIRNYLLPFLYFGLIYQILIQLNLHAKLRRVLDVLAIAISIYYIVRLIISILHKVINLRLEKMGETPGRIAQINSLLNIIKAFVWVIGFLFLLDNLGYNVTAILTTLGIGGVAIALAAQVILGDLFSYFAILFDKPFEIGDFIITSDEIGSVESVGFKTTRIRALSGEQLVVSNSELLKKTIHNYKRMQRRRVVINFGVKYKTPAPLLNEIPLMIREIVSAQHDVVFDRAHLSKFTTVSIEYEVVYYVLSPDYNKHMDVQQVVLMQIYEGLSAKRIEFAHFPAAALADQIKS